MKIIVKFDFFRKASEGQKIVLEARKFLTNSSEMSSRLRQYFCKFKIPHNSTMDQPGEGRFVAFII